MINTIPMPIHLRVAVYLHKLLLCPNYDETVAGRGRVEIVSHNKKTQLSLGFCRISLMRL
jgi:hypothetical protein